MGTLAKLFIAGLAVFLALGGPNRIKKKQHDRGTIEKPTATQPEQPQPSQPTAPAKPVTPPRDSTLPIPAHFNGRPDNLISSVDWLEKNATPMVSMQSARITYYLMARSDRCRVDSLPPCLQQAITKAGIDPDNFHYTYFLDRVMIAGSGILFWQGHEYLVNYARLRKAGWQQGARNFKNVYRCNGFAYKSKNPIEFIQNHIHDESVFVPIEKARHPNGLTASGQEAVDWHTVSVNPMDFPLSVPNNARRSRLTERFTLQKKRVPQARSFIVITSQDGRKFLTEAMDTGSGVKRNWIDWRIGNTSAEIKYFFGIGRTVKATCYILKDASVTFEQVLAASKPIAAK